MKRKIKFLGYLAIVMVFSFLICSIFNSYYIRYDNKTPKNEMITRVYDEKNFSSIMKSVDSRANKIKINQLNIKPQCIRKTDCGGYAIYNLKTSKELYIFFNEEKRIIAYTTVNKFASSDEIIQYKNGKASDVLGLGSGVSITTSGTADELLIYFLCDGKVAYVRFNDIIFDGNEKIDEIMISSNDEYLEEYEALNWQPYILPMDRY